MMRDEATLLNQRHNFVSKLRRHVSFTLPELKSKLIDDPPIATSVVPTFVIHPVVFGCHCFDDCRVDSLLSASIDVESVEKSGIILKPSMSMAVSSECDGSCMPLDRYWIPSSGEVLDHGANQQEGTFQTPASKQMMARLLVTMEELPWPLRRR
jgi:hypothetical protein